MKVFLKEDFTIDNIDTEEVTQDSVGYNILKVFVPEEVVGATDTFAVSYAALLPSSRKVGAFGMVYSSTDPAIEEGYCLFKATLHKSVVSYPGKVAISFQFVYGVDGNATLTKKNSAIIQFDVRKSVAVNNDILILDTDQTSTDVLESYKDLLETALNTYLTQANAATTYVAKTDIVDNLTTDDATKVLSAKQGKALKDNIAANAFTVADDSGLTLSNHKLAVKLKTGAGLVKNSNGIFIDYDPNRFMIDNNVKLNLHANYNVIPVNQSIVGSVGTPYQVTKTESVVGYTTTKTFTFNSTLMTQIKKNVQVRGYQGNYSNLAPVSTYANFAPRYALSFDLSDTTLNELFTDIVRSVDASYYAGAEKVILYPVGYYTNTDTYYYFATDYWHSKNFRITLMIKQESGSNTGFVRTWYESIENRYELDYINVCELSQIKTNKSNIASLQSEVNAIKDGTTLDSFADVEGAIDDVEDDVSALQTQVNNLSSVQNVADIVATKSALDALTTTNFEEDDKVQVIADETHDGASTVYNWTGSAWQYVGAYGGNSYTKAQTDALIDGKLETLLIPVAQVNNKIKITNNATISKLEDDWSDNIHQKIRFDAQYIAYIFAEYTDSNFDEEDLELEFIYAGYREDYDAHCYSCAFTAGSIFMITIDTTTYEVAGHIYQVPIPDEEIDEGDYNSIYLGNTLKYMYVSKINDAPVVTFDDSTEVATMTITPDDGNDNLAEVNVNGVQMHVFNETDDLLTDAEMETLISEVFD